MNVAGRAPATTNSVPNTRFVQRTWRADFSAASRREAHAVQPAMTTRSVNTGVAPMSAYCPSSGRPGG